MGISARKAEKFSVLRGRAYKGGPTALAGAAIRVNLGVVDQNGEIIDVIVSQGAAGASGTSWACQIVKGTTNVLSTASAITLAAGANKALDTRGKLAAVAGCTRPVLSTTKATRRVARGDSLIALFTPTGTYAGTFPDANVAVVVASDQ